MSGSRATPHAQPALKSSPDNATGAPLSIGEVARRAGLRKSAIRYYEAVGVLPEPERISGQRRYREEVLDQLAVLQVAQEAGFSLEDIGALLRSADDGDAADEIRALANRKLPDVRALIERAERVERWLELAADCQCATPRYVRTVQGRGGVRVPDLLIHRVGTSTSADR
jgi:MerR family transcriptional regulator, redox-sensitive transcriptional activator SoxR